MTTYTKTELIDMAIQKLGENPNWYNNTHVIHCISDTNSYYGEIRLYQVRVGINELNTDSGWRYICKREEFEQRIAERKSEAKYEWQYCPECGSYEVSYEEGAHKQCADCSQEWFSDVDYTDVVRSHLQDNYLGESKPKNEWWDYEKDKPLYFPPAGTKCETLYLSKCCRTVIIGLDSKGKCVFESAFLKDSYCFATDIKMFRPLNYKPALTERQQAGLKIYRFLNEDTTSSDEFILSYPRFEDYCHPYDQMVKK